MVYAETAKTVLTVVQTHYKQKPIIEDNPKDY